MTTTTNHPDPAVVAAREHIAGEVRALVARKKDKQQTVAHVIGRSRPLTHDKLQGERAFDMDELMALALHYEVDVVTFFPEPTASEGAA